MARASAFSSVLRRGLLPELRGQSIPRRADRRSPKPRARLADLTAN